MKPRIPWPHAPTPENPTGYDKRDRHWMKALIAADASLRKRGYILWISILIIIALLAYIIT